MKSTDTDVKQFRTEYKDFHAFTMSWNASILKSCQTRLSGLREFEKYWTGFQDLSDDEKGIGKNQRIHAEPRPEAVD